ncbi:hypothetical protein GCM10011515_13420 [Tsuneonella deserti]|uniref:Uncharacterized protein n=2 Tax=Tsuneonella deserti TaxID=2035528 RepID=A0ABQ1S9I9_9SPHN|nr:hypothetical protein GCM10011515_13420 [Tsuneonella deserti]
MPGGHFTAGEYRGTFDRSLDRWSFGGAIARRGHSDFTIAGPQISSTIEARCAMREHALDLGLAEVTMQPMAYRCDFTAEGRPIPARFELQEVVGGGSAITRYERRGEIALGGEMVRFRSVDHIAGTSMPSLTPVGYVFEQNGREIGALELTGRPALMLSAPVDPGVARTVTIAAVSLATFWDPAIHDLDM